MSHPASAADHPTVPSPFPSRFPRLQTPTSDCCDQFRLLLRDRIPSGRTIRVQVGLRSCRALVRKQSGLDGHDCLGTCMASAHKLAVIPHAGSARGRTRHQAARSSCISWLLKDFAYLKAFLLTLAQSDLVAMPSQVSRWTNSKKATIGDVAHPLLPSFLICVPSFQATNQATLTIILSPHQRLSSASKRSMSLPTLALTPQATVSPIASHGDPASSPRRAASQAG